MTEKEYWDWFGEYVDKCAKTCPFGFIHPYEPRKLAGEVFGFGMDVIRMWEWQDKNLAKIRRIINRVAKCNGMRMSKSETGYTKLERIPLDNLKGK